MSDLAISYHRVLETVPVSWEHPGMKMLQIQFIGEKNVLHTSLFLLELSDASYLTRLHEQNTMGPRGLFHNYLMLQFQICLNVCKLCRKLACTLQNMTKIKLFETSEA